jgi:hypothetical protein
MSPSLRDGEVLAVRAEPPRFGDVAVLRTGAGVVCHRRIWSRGGRVVVKGDGRAGLESYAVPRQARVLGRVVSVLRGGRFRPVGSRWLGLAASAALLPVRLLWR